MSNNENLKCRKALAVLKFHIPNRHTHQEEYCNSMLFLFFPFRNESKLKDGHPGSYSQKLADQIVINVANANRALVEPYTDVADEVIENLQFHANSDIDPLLEEHEPVEEEATENGIE